MLVQVYAISGSFEKYGITEVAHGHAPSRRYLAHVSSQQLQAYLLDFCGWMALDGSLVRHLHIRLMRPTLDHKQLAIGLDETGQSAENMVAAALQAAAANAPGGLQLQSVRLDQTSTCCAIFSPAAALQQTYSIAHLAGHCW